MNKVPDLAPPSAEKRPHRFSRHGVTIEDPWAWLRDANYPDVQDEDVLAYLKAENAYTEARTAHLKKLQDRLYNEMVARIVEIDTTAPVKIDDYYYYSRVEKGKQYSIYCRKKGTLSEKEEAEKDQGSGSPPGSLPGGGSEVDRHGCGG